MPRFFHLRWLPWVASSAELWNGGLHRLRSKRSPACSRPWKMWLASICWRSPMARSMPLAWTMVCAAASAVASMSEPRKCQPYSRWPSSG
ncbi:hypothetical protein D3C78_1517720 [compost metagenome]